MCMKRLAVLDRQYVLQRSLFLLGFWGHSWRRECAPVMDWNLRVDSGAGEHSKQMGA